MSDDRIRPASHNAELARWVREHWDAVFSLAWRLSHDQHLSEDLTQETFLRAAEKRTSFIEGTNLRAWLMRITTNAFLDHKRRKSTSLNQPLPEAPTFSDTIPGPIDRASNIELGAALDRAIGQLPDPMRAVFVLRSMQDLSFREIADVIDCTEQTARWHMFQARKKLMELLKDWL
jgi:RNA polymerase sigma-70 factor (ECF subfamily)